MSSKEYYNYLSERSFYGLIYRNFWLYPKLNKYLTGKALDIGCGIGDFLKYRKNTTGVDVNNHLVKYCKKNNLNAIHMEPDMLPFKDETFESAIMDNVLEHIIDPKPILSEARRVLQSKGRLIIGVPGSLGYKFDDDHKVFYSRNNLIETLNKNNFKLIKIFGMPFDLSWMDLKVKQYCVYGVFEKIGK